jgi:hypothetical protein
MEGAQETLDARKVEVPLGTEESKGEPQPMDSQEERVKEQSQHHQKT